MTRQRFGPARIMAGAVGAAALAGVAHIAMTWARYGRVAERTPDPLLDRFMPRFEVAERHEVRIAAPATATYQAALAVDITRSRLARALFRTRALLLGGEHVQTPAAPAGLVAQTLAMGWGVLAEEANRRTIVGAVTRPWEARVRFRRVPPDEFAAFDEPGYVKIIWTLAAESLGPSASIFRTETRVTTTDGNARRRFRLYWTAFSPGVRLVRRLMLRLVKSEAERSARAFLAAGRA